MLLAFCEFPAEHWKHSRTTSSIESVFATIRSPATRVHTSAPTPSGIDYDTTITTSSPLSE